MSSLPSDHSLRAEVFAMDSERNQVTCELSLEELRKIEKREAAQKKREEKLQKTAKRLTQGRESYARSKIQSDVRISR